MHKRSPKRKRGGSSSSSGSKKGDGEGGQTAALGYFMATDRVREMGIKDPILSMGLRLMKAGLRQEGIIYAGKKRRGNRSKKKGKE